jgi:DNA processing protein
MTLLSTLFMQITKLSYKSQEYPDILRNIAAPPKQLYVVGDIPAGPAIAIVGSRRPTQYGKQMTYKLASELAKAGVVIVSGLALGIDAMAHLGAVEAGGKTIAVQACGMDRIYPASNRSLAIKILRDGAIISEYPEGTEPFKSNFVARNRIIAGLCQAIIIPEADASSGSLHTVNFALQQGKTVMAVPGHVTSARSAGPNNLLRSGAVPITGTSDVLAALDLGGMLAKPVRARNSEEASVLELLGQGVSNSQEIIDKSGMSAAEFANIITLMEITGKVRNLGAGTWVSR